MAPSNSLEAAYDTDIHRPAWRNLDEIARHLERLGFHRDGDDQTGETRPAAVEVQRVKWLGAVGLATMVGGLVIGTPGRALGSERECRSFTSGLGVSRQHVAWRSVQAFQAINGTSKPTSVTWTVTRAESRDYEVSGEVGFDALFDFLKVKVNGRMMRSWSSSVGESLQATMPPHSTARGVYQVGVQHASGSQWYCDLQGKRRWRPYRASAPFGHRFSERADVPSRLGKVTWNDGGVVHRRLGRGGRGRLDPMGTIERSVEVDRPAADVWTVLEDVRRIPIYSPSTVAVNGAPERLSAVGQRFRQTVVVLGRRFESDWTVTELQPGRRVAFEGTLGIGARYCLVEEVEPRGPDRSRLTVRITFTLPLGLLGRLADALGAQRRAQREAEEVLANLKAHLEAPRAPSSTASGSVSYQGPADDAATRLRQDGQRPS